MGGPGPLDPRCGLGARPEPAPRWTRRPDRGEEPRLQRPAVHRGARGDSLGAAARPGDDTPKLHPGRRHVGARAGGHRVQAPVVRGSLAAGPRPRRARAPGLPALPPPADARRAPRPVSAARLLVARASIVVTSGEPGRPG